MTYNLSVYANFMPDDEYPVNRFIRQCIKLNEDIEKRNSKTRAPQQTRFRGGNPNTGV